MYIIRAGLVIVIGFVGTHAWECKKFCTLGNGSQNQRNKDKTIKKNKLLGKTE